MLATFSACERPFVPEAVPKIEVTEPGLDQVLTRPTVPIRIEATSFRPVARVEIDGQALARSEQSGTWLDTLHLQAGVNIFIITAYDEQGVQGTDTVRAIYLPLHVSGAAPPLPEPRGGHTATLLSNGDLLVTGGAPAYGGTATSEAFLLPRDGSAFTILGSQMTTPRAGHTANLLPDGRVLILGGAQHDSLQSYTDLLSTAELYDPATQSFRLVPFQGDPVRRIYHTTAVVTSGSETDVLVYGGVGSPPGYQAAEPLATVSRYVFRNDSLIAVGPRIGTFIGDPVYGHTQTLLSSDATASRFLVAGAFSWHGIFESDNFVMDVEASGEIGQKPIAPFVVPRTRHADAMVLPGLVGLFGGHGASISDVLASGEVFLDANSLFYSLPESVTLRKRFGHTATKLSLHRILLLGGFDADGTGLTQSEFLDIESE